MSDRGWRVLRAADHRRMPWKNGLGVTTELLIEPAGATLENFDWRLSMARVDSDGPFSTFRGIDRLLMVLEGSLTLTIDGRSCALSPESEVVQFAGEAAVSVTLTKASPESARPATDLNLMFRRGRFAAVGLSRYALTRHADWQPTPTTVALFCKTGDVRVDDGMHVEKLGADDLVVLTPGATKWPRLVFDSPADIYGITLERSGAGGINV